MADAAEEVTQETDVSATDAAPAGAQGAGFAPVVSGATALAGEVLGFAGATTRAGSGLMASAAAPALVLLAAGFVAARWARRK